MRTQILNLTYSSETCSEYLTDGVPSSRQESCWVKLDAMKVTADGTSAAGMLLGGRILQEKPECWADCSMQTLTSCSDIRQTVVGNRPGDRILSGGN